MKQIILIVVSIVILWTTSCKDKNNAANIVKDGDTSATANQEMDILSEKIAKDSTNASLYFARATQYYQDSLPQPAMNDLLKAISLDSSKASYHLLLSDVYFQTGNMVYAIEEAKVARTLDPTDIDIKNKLAKYYVLTRAYDNGLLILKEAHLMSPNNAQAYFIESIIYMETGKEDKCIKSLKTCLEKDPDYIDAHMQLAAIYNRKNSDECLRYYDYALKIDSTYMLARYGKALYMQDHGQIENAKKEYTKMIMIDKNYSNAYYNMGFILFHEDSIEKAMRQFEIAIKVYPTYAQAYYMRGKCSEKMGNTEKAIADYKQALIFKEDFELAKKAIEKISSK